MCLCSRKKSEVRLETQPPVSILQRSPLKTKNSPQNRTIRKGIQRNRIPLSKEELKSQFEEIQKALGVEPNSALIDRIHSFKEPAKDLSIKKGDLIFSLKELKKVPKASGNNKYDSKQNVRVQKCELDADDDTLYPKPISMSKNEADQDEVDDEVQLEEPNSENYMYNEQEILFVCHDMIRQLNKVSSSHIFYKLQLYITLNYSQRSVPKLSIEREFGQHFNRNTRVRSVCSSRRTRETRRNKVTFNEKVFDITDWEEFACTAEEGSERTQTDSELELVETQDILPLTSNETLERSPKRKTPYFPKILWETSSTIKSATINSADSVDQSSKPETFTKTEISSISSHKKETFRNNPELRLETDLKKKDKNGRNSVM
ncbi:unnamed protein product [Brugia timori]|uniref:Bm10565, isoform b n=2 Tax=Brugia TaxID=6278 RepID=A0A1U7F429_BRUMA|nr:Bm10565, isoform b [Brugia malayi]VDO24331.1 unnamed protein product [Brugia timori]